jgi:hypothetical protein
MLDLGIYIEVRMKKCYCDDCKKQKKPEALFYFSISDGQCVEITLELCLSCRRRFLKDIRNIVKKYKNGKK